MFSNHKSTGDMCVCFLKDLSKLWNTAISLVEMEFIHCESQAYYVTFCLDWWMANLGCLREVNLNSTLPIVTSAIKNSSVSFIPKCSQS